MLLAVEGGGFFSASASGYSKFLSLLLFGQKNEERPMRVSPWNQYQLVDEEVDPEIQLAPRKNLGSRGCAIFICFGHPSTGVDGNPPPKVGPVHQSDLLPDPSIVSEQSRNSTTSEAIDENGNKILLKSSIKKPPVKCSAMVREADTQETLDEVENDIAGNAGTRKVQWTDACGRDLVEIREFEPSDEGASDDELERDGFRRCECVIQ